MLGQAEPTMVGIEFDRTSIPKTSKHSLCHNSPCTNHSKIALSFEKHYILASLIKGEVLSPEKIRATTGVIAFLPHPFRFSDTSVNNHSIVGSASHCNRSSPLHKGAKGDSALPTIPKLHYPLPRTITLASLVKGRWLDGTTQTVALLRPACDMSALFILQTFCRQDGGIAIPPFAQHHIYASLVKGEVLSPERIRATTGGIATPLLPKPHYPLLCTITLAL